MEVANTEGEAYWSARADRWLADEEALEVVGGPPGERAIERLAPRPGERIMDVGCGGGPTSLALGARVGPSGAVVGIDISPGMVAGATRRAEEAGVGNATFRVADAQVADLGAGTFDAAFSRFGVMFFADPVAAFANIRRALVPGGRLSFSSWQDPWMNEWMSIPTMATLSVLDVQPPPAEPGAPGPFSLADPDRVGLVLREAGFRDVDVLAENDHVSIPTGAIRVRAEISARQGLAAELLREAPDDARERVVDAVESGLRSRVSGDAARLSRGVLLVTARA